MSIKVIYDIVRKQAWAVRLVQQGDAYGLDEKLVHEKAEPLVEFYDTRHAHTNLGQFVSRYYLSTLLERPLLDGLQLDGGTESWRVSGPAMERVQEWLRTVSKKPPTLPMEALRAAMQRKVLEQTRATGFVERRWPHADNYWSVMVLANGAAVYGDYAELARGPRGDISQLTLVELAHLLSA